MLAQEAIGQAIRLVGRDRVYILVFEENRHIVDVLGLIPERNVLTICTRTFLALVISLCKQSRQILRLRIDASIDLEFFSRTTAILAWVIRAEYRVGFYSKARGTFRGNLLTHSVNFDPRMHTARSFQSLVTVLGESILRQRSVKLNLEPLLRFKPTQAEKRLLQELLISLGAIEGEPIVLLNANAGDLLPQRKWPGANYVLLAKKLIQRWPEILVLFTGSFDENGPVETLVRAVGSTRCQSFAGRTDLRTLLTLYMLADVLVTNDSGPAHFAALTDIKVVALFGPETPALFAAQTPNNHILWSHVPCSPCVNAFNQRQTTCQNNICMQSITVDQVYAKVVGLCQWRIQPAYA